MNCVLTIGNAGAPMALAVEDTLGDCISERQPSGATRPTVNKPEELTLSQASQAAGKESAGRLITGSYDRLL
jgi:hypothetical protein